MIRIFYYFLALACTLSLTSCGAGTIGPSAKQYAVESDAINGEMTVHEGPGVKDYFNVFDGVTYYDKVDGYSFSSAADEANQPIEIRFANNGKAFLSGHTDYRLPEGAEMSKMEDIEETYGSAEKVKQRLIRQALEKSAFTSGQFMNVFDALSKNRSYLQELIFDQANNGQYQVIFNEEVITDIATGKDKVVKVSDRIPCIDSTGNSPNCIGGYLRTEESALRIYGIELFNFTVKQLVGEASIEAAIASNLVRSNKMEELAIQAREAQVDAATTVEKAKALVAEEQAAKEIAVATAEKETAVAAERKKQAEYEADAIFYAKKKEAEADKLKVLAGLSPREAAEFKKATAIGIAQALSKRPVPLVTIDGKGSGSGNLEQAYSIEKMLLLAKEIQKESEGN